MRACLRLIVCLVALALLGAFSPLHAVWIEQGVPVCTATGFQMNADVATLTSGDAIVVWRDNRSGTYDIYAQRLSRGGGRALWTENGVLISTTGISNLYGQQVVSDGAGGAIIAWYDARTGYEKVMAQRVDADGNPLWTANGEYVCEVAGYKNSVSIAADGAGGAIIAWVDLRGSDRDIYVQRVDAEGNMLWTADGVPACGMTGQQYDPRVVSDGTGGGIVAWHDLRGTNYDIYAQRIDADGYEIWWEDGEVICAADGSQSDVRLIPDGAGGAILTWDDTRDVSYDVYAQRIVADGYVLWGSGGVAVSTAANSQRTPRIASDGARGAIIAWQDSRSGQDDIYAQRVDASGNMQWTADGVVVCDETNNQMIPVIVSDGTGGAIIAWQDQRANDMEYDLYAQAIDGTGTARWADNGVALCTVIGTEAEPAIATDGAGGAYMAWYEDGRSDACDVYAQRVERNGYWGYPAPEIAAVRDVPGDQGGSVNLSWEASRLDPWPEQLITRYSVWRAIDPGQAALMAASGAAALTNSPGDAPDRDVPAIRVEETAAGTFYWKLISTVDAWYLESYAEVVPTLFDSTGACDERHYFQVIAHTADPLLCWVSEPDSGYSVDNLAPEAPVGLAAAQSYTPDGMLLTWSPNAEIDLAGYRVYRGLDSGFVPGEGYLVTSTPDTTAFDGGWTWEAGYWYKVSAVDIHGNESPFAVTGPGDVTGDDPMPAADFLAQNYPNPFNPLTTVRFGLREAGPVRLGVYDAAGRLVRSLFQGRRPAGVWTVQWDGRDDGGRDVASGMYFYRLRAGNFERTRKMVLLR
ncbi:MAG: T9SS type A sorting domain-containing protein [Candidatus Krumholzibacteriota bacterium]|nr:T9SS type A sorting domain-containing protein [Candidatus Krumholzibacteriota bacterium]